MLIGNSVYVYDDSPAFRLNNLWNYLAILINIIFFVLFSYSIKIKSTRKLKIFLLIFYGILELIYLRLVPIKPFSDMKFVIDIALSNLTEGMEYLQRYPNNLPITLVFNIILRLTNYNVWAIKIFNVISNIVILYFVNEIYKNLYKKENILIILLGITILPVFLYVNMTYNDVLYVMLFTVTLYLITKNDKNRIQEFLISIFLFLQYIIRPVGIILIIATIMYYIFKERNLKIVCQIILIFILLNLGHTLLKNSIILKSDTEKPYPVWSFIQMGFNEKEFGFQDGSHSQDWEFSDVTKRIHDMGPVRFVKLLAKKEYWLWTEGTYQTERYAFGVGEEDTFYYDTFITSKLYDLEDSGFRKAVDYIMKGQYFIFIVLSIVDLMIMDENIDLKKKKELFLYITIGLFCFYLIWEMKSRYIYCMYPIFLIFATSAVDKIFKRYEKK